MKIVDLRSDTVTAPTSQMRKAMYEAEVGDDVYKEDPTINKLEALAAEISGKQAALFVTSGTMGNQIAAMVHSQKGTEIICDSEAHIFYSEAGGLACLSGAQVRTLNTQHGILTPELIEDAIRAEDVHAPETALICLENTHNRAGGTCYSVKQLAEVQKVAKAYGIPVHIDGARIFNAAVALKATLQDLCQYGDTVQFCLSKGLCAPVGSIIVGSHEHIKKARRMRKMLGGGLRQAGILAAAGIVALTTMVERLQEDHVNARVLAEGAADLGLIVDLATVQTNIVIADVSVLNMSAADFIAVLGSHGVKCIQFGKHKVRFVTHYGITREDIDYTLMVLTKVLKKQE